MDKKIKIKLLPDGRIEALTHDIKGKACLDYLPLLESLLEAKAVDSNFTPEYYQVEDQLSETVQEQTFNENVQEF